MKAFPLAISGRFHFSLVTFSPIKNPIHMSNSEFFASTLLSLSIKIAQAVGGRRGGEPGTQRSLLWEILLPEASPASPQLCPGGTHTASHRWVP